MNSIGESIKSCQIDMVSVKSYKSQNEYLIAMKEDLSEWFKELYFIEINADNFFDFLENGCLLCNHANKLTELIMSLNLETNITSLVYRNSATPGSFQARDNISIFIHWCKKYLSIPDTLIFETEDLVQRRNERNVILGLLEVGRRGSHYGMLAPSIIQLELEIDEEIRRDKEFLINNRDDTIAKDTTDLSILNFSKKIIPDKNDDKVLAKKIHMPVDLLSLDEMVRIILKQCKCEFQYPMVRLSEGKYTHGDNFSPIFLRVLRSHVMVRIGGGWDTLNSYLDRHDPCRCNSKENRGSFAFISKPLTKTSETPKTSNNIYSDYINSDIRDCANYNFDVPIVKLANDKMSCNNIYEQSNASDSLVSSLSSLSTLSISNINLDNGLLRNTISSKSLNDKNYISALGQSVKNSVNQVNNKSRSPRKSLPENKYKNNKMFVIKSEANESTPRHLKKNKYENTKMEIDHINYLKRAKSLSRENFLENDSTNTRKVHTSRQIYLTQSPINKNKNSSINSKNLLNRKFNKISGNSMGKILRRHSQDYLISSSTNDCQNFNANSSSSWSNNLNEIKAINSNILTMISSYKSRKDHRKDSISRIPIPVATLSQAINSLKRSDSGVDVWDARDLNKNSVGSNDLF